MRTRALHRACAPRGRGAGVMSHDPRGPRVIPALRATHGPLPANPDAFNKWPSMKEVTMAFLDDAGVPPAF